MQSAGIERRRAFTAYAGTWSKFPIVLLTGSMDALSCEERALFARCIDKSMPIKHLVDTIAELQASNQVPISPPEGEA